MLFRQYLKPRADTVELIGIVAVLPADTPDNPLRNTQDVSTLLAESINQVRRGQLGPRVANSAGHLASILLGALQQGPLEERLART
jgi:hypothetical protein